jgi:hypothetical protein
VPRSASERAVRARIGEFIRGLPDHPLLDRIVRGRAWIALLGLMLGGIVAMQVEVLKLNASLGRSLGLSSSLQSRNGMLRASVSSLSDAGRIERLATRMGMVMVGPTAWHFLNADEANPAKAAASIHAPGTTGFGLLAQSAPTLPTAPTTLTTATASSSTAVAQVPTGTTNAATGFTGSRTAPTTTSTASAVTPSTPVTGAAARSTPTTSSATTAATPGGTAIAP